MHSSREQWMIRYTIHQTPYSMHHIQSFNDRHDVACSLNDRDALCRTPRIHSPAVYECRLWKKRAIRAQVTDCYHTASFHRDQPCRHLLVGKRHDSKPESAGVGSAGCPFSIPDQSSTDGPVPSGRADQFGDGVALMCEKSCTARCLLVSYQATSDIRHSAGNIFATYVQNCGRGYAF